MKTRLRIKRLFTAYSLGLGLLIAFLGGFGVFSIPVVRAANIAVNSLADNTANDGECTLREAIIAANTDSSSGSMANECPGGSDSDIIDLIGLSGVISLSTTLPDITSNMVLNGPGASNLIIDGGGVVRILKITAGDVTISGLTLVNGYIGPNDGHGGGIFNSSPGIVTIINSTLSNNQARGADGVSANNGGASGCCFGGGGGVYQGNLGRLNIIKTTFANNTAMGGYGGQGGWSRGGGGGGGAFGGAIFSDGGVVTVMTSTFSANQVIGGDGGTGLPNGSGPNLGGGGGGQYNGLGGGGRGGGYTGPGVNGQFGGGGGGGGAYDNGGLGGFAGGNSGGPEGGGGGGGGLGGAIFHNTGVMTISYSTFADNEAFGGSGSDGRFGRSEDGQGVGQAIFNRAVMALINNDLPNTAPVISNIVPAQNATNVSVTQALSWETADGSTEAFVDVQDVTVDLAIGLDPALLTVQPDVTSPVSFPLPLQNATTYYWVITATDGLSVTSSGLLSFTTAAKPVADFTAVPQIGTAPLTVNFSNDSADADTYLWNFGDGQTSMAISPTHQYAATGVYTVSLVASGPGGSHGITRTHFISVFDAPQASFEGAPLYGTETLTTVFTNTSQYADSFLWNYGDGETSATAAVTHTHYYTTPGIYTVTLTAINPYGTDVLTRTNYIAVFGTAIADFTASPLFGGAPLQVNFTNHSLNAYYYEWNFGDGIFNFFEENPTHTYAISGVYTVTLTAFGALTTDVFTRSAYITVGDFPIPAFSAEPRVGQPPLTVVFTNTSQLADTYLWDYGDGTTGTTTAVTHTHTYIAPGFYTVALRATNAYGTAVQTHTNYIALYEPPIANFSAAPLTGGLPLPVSFSNSSQNATNYSWNFGDGTTSVAANPLHTYHSPGVYTVTLTASNPIGVDTVTQQNYITAYETPLSGLAASNNSPTELGQPTQLQATISTGSNVAYIWDFGDGSKGSGAMANHIYASIGDYPAIVTATNSVGELTATTIVKVRSPFNVIAFAPANNAQSVPANSIVSVTFDRTIDSSTVTPPNFTVWGSQTGVYPQSYTVSDNQVIFDAQPNYKPGEFITVNLGPGIKSTDGIRLTPSAWHFYVDVGEGLGYGSGTFVKTPQTFGEATYSWSTALGDVDRDGDLDAFVGNSHANRIWLNDGTGTFTAGQSIGGDFTTTQAAMFGDLNGDGYVDLVVGNYGNGTEIWLNNGAGTLNKSQTLGSTQYTFAVKLGDLDGDGDLDVFVGNGSGNQANYVWLNNGTGHFVSSGQNIGNSDTQSLALGDLDGDGDLDAFVGVGGYSDRRDKVWLNDGTGIFSDTGQLLSSLITRGVALGDLDGDGDLDAFVASSQANTPPPNSVWLNDGQANFVDSGQSIGLAYSLAVDLGDVDGDGDLDVFVGNYDDNSRSRVWLNDGSSQFITTGQNVGGPYSYGVALGDLDNDGDLDAFVANYRTEHQVWLNQNAPGSSLIIPVFGGIITPTLGVTLSAESGVFSDAIRINYTAQPVTDTGTLDHVGLFYDVSATYVSTGQPAQPQPGQRYAISVTYRQENVPAGFNESDLALYFWDGQMWIKEPTSLVDTTRNTITASPDHFSLWAALGPKSSDISQKYFLPIILKP